MLSFVMNHCAERTPDALEEERFAAARESELELGPVVAASNGALDEIAPALAID
jgi:hypothetical protein